MTDAVENRLSIEAVPLTEELVMEISPLAQKCWDECSDIKKDTCSFHGERGFRIEPDIEQYLKLSDSGSLIAMTLRDDGVLCGYALVILYRSLHHSPVRCANVDNIYIEPRYRLAIVKFIARMEQEFEKIGIVVVGWPTSPDGPLFDTLEHLGYRPDDVVMEKRICALQRP